MADIKRKVEDSKSGKLNPKVPENKGIEVNWGNAEKIKILLLQAINNHLAAIVTMMRDDRADKVEGEK